MPEDDKDAPNQNAPDGAGGPSLGVWLFYLTICGALAFWFLNREPKIAPVTSVRPAAVPKVAAPVAPKKQEKPARWFLPDSGANHWDPAREVRYYWEGVPTNVVAKALDTGGSSNIRKADYVGAETCAKCHKSNHDDWEDHPHRWMNAMATPEAVRGDFSGKAKFNYKGGTGTFTKVEGRYRMTVQRGDNRWVYDVNRTIGSRFFQYYVGTLAEGYIDDEPRGTIDHVLPFGYWIGNREWVPTVHLARDSMMLEDDIDPYDTWQYTPYDITCSECHTTWAFGDWMLKVVGGARFPAHTPFASAIDLPGYFKDAHAGRLRADYKQMSNDEIEKFLDGAIEQIRLTDRVSLGVTCEACHLGVEEHVRHSTPTNSTVLPSFFPVSPHFHSNAEDLESLTRRNPKTTTFICGRCHSGTRPQYANGIHTWNSTEFTDSINGHCYDPKLAADRSMESLSCVHCHDPHDPIGPRWKSTPAEDDQRCLECHQQFVPEAKLVAHTHHAANTEGSRCMNCHMPRINEGLQDIVRTHRIFSPTDDKMIAANHPNACNLCHLDKNIDWTITKLREWYKPGFSVPENYLAETYPHRSGPVALNWLHSVSEAVRLVGADAVIREEAWWALPEVLDLIATDKHMINRQFTQKRLNEKLGYDLRKHDFQFYDSPEHRLKRMADLKPDILKLVAEDK